MLHFFKVEELASAIRVADRFTNDLRGVRDQVTNKLNEFMRRRLDYEAGVVEYFNTPGLYSGGSFNVWLRKKAIEALAIGLSYSRAWDDYPLDAERFELDAEMGKLSLNGIYRPWERALRITYDGGYRPLEDDAEVMNCPYGLKFAAIQQGIFDARRAFGMDQGTSTDDDKKTPITLKYNGLLPETAAAFMSYRRTLGQ